MTPLRLLSIFSPAAGGAAGGAGGYFLSPHIHPMNLSYIDTDKATVPYAIKHYWNPGSVPSLVETRPISFAEMLGAAGNPSVLNSGSNKK